MNDKIFVIAGNYTQFKLLKTQLQLYSDIDLNTNNIVYLDNPNVIRGIRSPWGYLCGTWKDKQNLEEIKTHILLCGSTMEDFIEVEL